MELSGNIISAIDKIDKSGKKWFAIYEGLWTYANVLKSKCPDESGWDNISIRTNLPAFKNRERTYTLREYYPLLTTQDEYITHTHLVALFAMFEALVLEVSKEVFPPKLRDKYNWSDIEKFLVRNKFLRKDGAQIKELKLAKETRNRYVHTGSKITNNWIVAYKSAGGKHVCKEDDDLRKIINMYHKTEKWHKLVAAITNKIKVKISKI